MQSIFNFYSIFVTGLKYYFGSLYLCCCWLLVSVYINIIIKYDFDHLAMNNHLIIQSPKQHTPRDSFITIPLMQLQSFNFSLNHSHTNKCRHRYYSDEAGNLKNLVLCITVIWLSNNLVLRLLNNSSIWLLRCDHNWLYHQHLRIRNNQHVRKTSKKSQQLEKSPSKHVILDC